MSDYKTLLKFEYQKIFQRKLFWITLAIMISLTVLMVFSGMLTTATKEGTYYSKMQENKRDSLALSGRKIDNALLEEFRKSNKRIPDGLSYFFAQIYNGYNLEEYRGNIYQKRIEMIRNNQKDYLLSAGEIHYMGMLEDKVVKPIEFQYCEGYKKMITMFYALGIMQLLFITICIPPLFAEEHSKKMDQLNMCSRYGRKELLSAKILVGITITGFVTLLLTISAATPIFLLYGTHGFGASVQLIFPLCSYSLSVGQTTLLIFGISLTANAHRTIIVMLLTELLHNVLAVSGIMMGGLLLILAINIPVRYRLLSEVRNMLPTNSMSVWGFMDIRPVPFFGHYFSLYQFNPVIYIIIAFLGCAGIRSVYLKYQIS